MFRFAPITAGVLLFLAGAVIAQEHRIETIDEHPPEEDLASDVFATLAPSGIRVIRGPKRTVCEFWPCKEWTIRPGFTANSEVLYPFKPGQLIGALRLRRRGSDFRDQQISRGVYTLRYGLQPIDGNHEGTSVTRDFLLMVRAEDDDSPSAMDVERLSELSAAAAQSNHPAMMSLKQASHENLADGPQLHHDHEEDWWILQFAGAAVAGEDRHQLVVGLVVAGHADE